MSPERRLPLACLPTPVARMDRLSERLGIDLWIKRDDLTGVALSGNKVRKLERLLAEALQRGADTVITCGGVQSNHCRATAVAARQVGLDPVLLLRGEPADPPDGNILLDRVLGAHIRTCTPEAYRDEREALMEGIADELRGEGRTPYVIPEGGSNATGALAYADAGAELVSQEGRFDHIFVAVGSGGTLAGLAMADAGPVTGVAVCDDAVTFEATAARLASEAGAKLGELRVLEGFHEGPELDDVRRTIHEVARLEGILLGPVYTGKAMAALMREARAGRLDGRVLFWHTGGIFELFGRGSELA